MHPRGIVARNEAELARTTDQLRKDTGVEVVAVAADLSAAKRRGISFDEMVKQKVASIPAGRMGEPQELGDLCAWVCSAPAGYFTGQNVLLDGGLYPGTL